jgi:hypothetical protein
MRDEYHVAKTQKTIAIHNTLTLQLLSRLDIRRSFPCDKLQKQEYAANKNKHAGNISHTYLRKMVNICSNFFIKERKLINPYQSLLFFWGEIAGMR